MRFGHLGISVRDIERSIAFYEAMLGLEKLCEVFPFGGEQFLQIMALPRPTGRMCMIGRGDIRLELFEFATPTPGAKAVDYPVSDHGLSHFAVEVEDVDAVHARLAAAGVTIHCPVLTFPGGVRALYARDPDGNVFEVLQNPPEEAR